VALAKITRPRLAGVFPRARLFRLLDRARRQPVTWVAAPPGAGKRRWLPATSSQTRSGLCGIEWILGIPTSRRSSTTSGWLRSGPLPVAGGHYRFSRRSIFPDPPPSRSDSSAGRLIEAAPNEPRSGILEL
jgi:hypothetical protein